MTKLGFLLKQLKVSYCLLAFYFVSCACFLFGSLNPEAHEEFGHLRF